MKRVLVVDSDEQVASILGIKLKHAGFEAASAGNSADALKIIPDFRPDLIVSEMILPQMSGIDFMKRVKMNPETMNVPFVFLSSSRDVENKILALSMGGAAVFAKPLFISDLLENINELMGLYGSKGASQPEEKTPEGDVSDISALNILSILLENKSSGEVEFSASSDKKGAIFCDRGNVVRAETEGGENRDGMEELYKILSWSDGTFAVNYGDIDVERNIFIPQKKIIEKSAAWFREYSALLHAIPPVDTTVYLDFEKFTENLNRLPGDIDAVIRNIGENGSRICDIIDSCGNSILSAASGLKQLFDLGVVSLENREEPAAVTPEESSPESAERPSEDTEKKVEEGPASEEETDSAKPAGRLLPVLFLLLALAAAAAIFIYYRGLI